MFRLSRVTTLVTGRAFEHGGCKACVSFGAAEILRTTQSSEVGVQSASGYTKPARATTIVRRGGEVRKKLTTNQVTKSARGGRYARLHAKKKGRERPVHGASAASTPRRRPQSHNQKQPTKAKARQMQDSAPSDRRVLPSRFDHFNSAPSLLLFSTTAPLSLLTTCLPRGSLREDVLLHEEAHQVAAGQELHDLDDERFSGMGMGMGMGMGGEEIVGVSMCLRKKAQPTSSAPNARSIFTNL